VLATAGGLVFQGGGAITGELTALRATDGAVIWKHHLPNGVQAAPVTYSINSEQYIAVVSGAGAQFITGASEEYASQVGRVVAFKIGGQASVPPDPGPPPPLNPSTHRWPDEVVTRGKELYRDNCWRCHGVLAMASNVLPDLRRSSALQDSEAWRVIVLNGALASQGMVSFSRFLSQSDVDAVRAYVVSEAQQAARGKSSTRPVSGHPQ